MRTLHEDATRESKQVYWPYCHYRTDYKTRFEQHIATHTGEGVTSENTQLYRKIEEGSHYGIGMITHQTQEDTKTLQVSEMWEEYII